MGIEKAAAWLDWPKQRLYKLCASGEIPHFKQEGRGPIAGRAIATREPECSLLA
jgi:hypothetical protein